MEVPGVRHREVRRNKERHQRLIGLGSCQLLLQA